MLISKADRRASERAGRSHTVVRVPTLSSLPLEDCNWGVSMRHWHRVGWDATDNKNMNGGAERTVWETLLDMEGFDYRASENDPRAITLVLDLGKALERVSLPVVWACATHSNLPS